MGADLLDKLLAWEDTIGGNTVGGRLLGCGGAVITRRAGTVRGGVELRREFHFRS